MRRREPEYDPREDPAAVKAHDLYTKVIEHLPECPTCKRFKFTQVDDTVALAVGPRGVKPAEAFKLFCPEAQGLVRAYNAAMSDWLETLAE